MKNILLLLLLSIALSASSQSNFSQIDSHQINGEIVKYSVTEYYANGVIKVQGQFDAFGNKTGFWISRWENGNLMHTGTWNMGVKHGEQVSYNLDGVPILISSWKLGKKHGSFKRYSDDGDRLVEQREYRRGRLTESFRWNQENGGLLIVKL